LEYIARLDRALESAACFCLYAGSRRRQQLGREILKGGARYGAHDVPTDELIAEFYEGATTRLEAIGIHRYEIRTTRGGR